MKRLRAFTLLEALLALVLVALLGSFAFYILQDLQAATSNLGGRFGKEEELLWFSTAVRADFDRSDAVRTAPNKDVLCQSTTDTVYYAVVHNGIERRTSDGEVHVFPIPVYNTEVIADLAPDLVSLWRIDLTDETHSLPLAFRKVYATADRIPLPPNHAYSDSLQH